MSRRPAVCLLLLPLLLVDAAARQAPVVATPRYRLITVDDPATLRDLRRVHGDDGFNAILHVNRLDLPHVRAGALIVVPETPASQIALTPFPAALGTGPWVPARLLIVSRRVQAFAAYEHGTLVRWGAVSTGRRETPTPAGLFATNWKSKLRRSSDNADWLLPWYVNFINASGVSFHEFALPGYPASHACVRLLVDDAKWIYDWAESWVLGPLGQSVSVYGTPVLVFGDYAFDQPAPWTRLADDPRAADVTLDELRGALAPHQATIETRAALRAQWLAARPPVP